MGRRLSPETCPHCGTELPRGARVCRECGSDDRTGWSDSAAGDRLGLPEDPERFDYEDFVAREFGAGGGAARRRAPRRRWWWWVALVLGFGALIRFLWRGG